MMGRPALVVFTVLSLSVMSFALGACSQNRSTNPYTATAEFARDPLKAQQLTREAAAIINEDPAKAETLLRDALTADLYHGPAHNNLGALYLKQGKLYEAAGEFEWARKLLPGHPDPRLNMAITLERAGQIDEAIAGYHAALEVYPEHLPTVQALARCQLRNNRTDAHTARYLELVALRGNEQWRDWARTLQFPLTSQP